MAGNRTRVNCLEGNYANHYTTIANTRGASNVFFCKTTIDFLRIVTQLLQFLTRVRQFNVINFRTQTLCPAERKYDSK